MKNTTKPTPGPLAGRQQDPDEAPIEALELSYYRSMRSPRGRPRGTLAAPSRARIGR